MHFELLKPGLLVSLHEVRVIYRVLSAHISLGPVLLDFPIDVLFSPIQPKLIAWGSVTSPPSFPPGPHVAAIDAAARLLGAAQRPVIITGTGARIPRVRSP
jgi:thiamine pyrophosphate-dependent acetolactate synthase large subunit-like protein